MVGIRCGRMAQFGPKYARPLETSGLSKPMTFEEWADILELRAKLVPDTAEGDRNPWRCVGPCDQLMYGVEWVDGKLYPTPENTPSGLFISKDILRVCHVCWELYHAVERSPTGYWQGLSAGDKKKYDGLHPGGNYLTT
jgi:hypothetical protein